MRLPFVACVLAVSSLAISGLAAPSLGYGQEAVGQMHLQQKIAKQLDSIPQKWFVTLTVENDLFGFNRDENYTSGVRVTLFDVGAKRDRMTVWLDDRIPTFDINDTTSTYYALGQNIYTPRHILTSAAQSQDRPWAAFLYGTVGAHRNA